VASPRNSIKKSAGHRSWAARSGKAPGTHCGDIMSPESRSRVMARIRSRDTSPEKIICAELRRNRLRFLCHAGDLPGRPDVVFRELRVAVFIDGDFWHGWRFPLWKHKLSERWQRKIESNRDRDLRNQRRLRRAGWKVIRIWEHQIERHPEQCVARIMACLETRRLSAD